MTGAACGAGHAYPAEHLILPLVFVEIHVVLSFLPPYFMVTIINTQIFYKHN